MAKGLPIFASQSMGVRGMGKPELRAPLEQPLLSTESVVASNNDAKKPFRGGSDRVEDNRGGSSSSLSGPASSSPHRNVLKVNPVALVATLVSLAITAFLVTSIWPLPSLSTRSRNQRGHSHSAVDVVLREDPERTRRFLRAGADPFSQETASSGVALRPRDYDAQSKCGALKEEPSFALFEPEYHSADFPGVQGSCAVDGAFEMLYWSGGDTHSNPDGLQVTLGRRRKLQLFLGRPSFQERSCLPRYETLESCLRCCGAGCQASDGSTFRGRQCVPKGDTPTYTKTPSLTRTGSLDSRWMSVSADGGSICRSHGAATCFLEATGAKGGPVMMSDKCSGFETLDSCRSCCETCRAEPPNATFEGRGCSAVGQPVRRPALGRPFLDQSTGKALLAPLVDATEASSRAWSPVAAATRGPFDSVAAQAWEEAAVAEYSSVGSFTRHLLDLMAVGGAPPLILEDVAAAAADEVRHAAASLQVARLLRGPDAPLVVPGALPMPSAPKSPPQLSDLAVEVLKDGCVEETVSAALAVAADFASASDTGAEGPALGSARAAVAAIAREEAAHAQLAWRTLSWALEQQQPGIHESVQAHLLELKSMEAPPQGHSGAPAGSVNPHYGTVSRADEKLRVREAVMTRIVAPWLDALLEQPLGRGSLLRKSLEDPARGRGEYMLAAIAAALQQGPEAGEGILIGVPGAADDEDKETEL